MRKLLTNDEVRDVLRAADKHYTEAVGTSCYGTFLTQISELLDPDIHLPSIGDPSLFRVISTLRSLHAFAVGVAAHSEPTFTLVDSKPKFVIADGVTALDSIKGALSPEEFTAYCKGVALQKIFEGDVDSLAEAATYLNKAVANS